MIRHNHEERLRQMGRMKRLPKPNGTPEGTQPADYNLNLATLWIMELTTIDLMHIHDAVHAGATNKKEMATELMHHLYSLENELSPAAYAGIYYHINAVINE